MTPEAREAARLMDRLGREAEPFFFLFDFELQQPLVLPLPETARKGIFYDFAGLKNHSFTPAIRPAVRFQPLFPSFAEYQKAFRIVREAETRGDSYLVNLTLPTPLDTDLSLREIFTSARADYRLLIGDNFTVFSPETFVEIRDNIIRTYPMKGTRKAEGAEEEEALRADAKENAEHITVVDLLRNDLSIVATKTRVEEFKTLSRVTARGGDLLQMHSVVAADLGPDWPGRIGGIITSLLPAGSVTGAPKKRTLEIIREAESGPRGYYTGVAGVFDGRSLRSAVLIRFIEKTPAGLVYRSGGGITVYSSAEAEYEELKEKVYVPFD